MFGEVKTGGKGGRCLKRKQVKKMKKEERKKEDGDIRGKSIPGANYLKKRGGDLSSGAMELYQKGWGDWADRKKKRKGKKFEL